MLDNLLSNRLYPTGFCVSGFFTYKHDNTAPVIGANCVDLF